MAEYQKGDAYNALKEQFLVSIVGTEHHIEVAKTLAILDAINDLEGHFAQRLKGLEDMLRVKLNR